MNWFSNLRALAFLRRIARAAERQADSLETLARIELERWSRESAPRHPKHSEFGQLDVAEAERRYRKIREAEEAGVEL